MFDRASILKLLAANVLGLAFIYARFSQTPKGVIFNLQVQAWLSQFIPGARVNCGLLKWEDYYITSDRVLLEDGFQPAALHIVRGKIAGISHTQDVHGTKVLSFQHAMIIPGAIDVHIHLNEPGREEWEGIKSGTRAAAAGGVTTVIDMPLNSFPVTTTVEQLRRKMALARKKAAVNIGYWAGLVPENAADHQTLGALVSAGAAGFKSFMCPSGINDFGHVTAADIAAALPFLKRAGVPFFVHAELVSDLPPPKGDPTVYATYMHTRPPKFEQDAIKLLVELLDNDTTAAAPGFSVHIAHLADAGALPIIKEAQKRHPITAETCAHYLTFTDAMVPDNATWYKCAPPIRDASNRDALLKAVMDGDIVLVSSDHSPAPPEMKQLQTGNFLRAWGGISGAQYLLPATWTAIRQHGGDVRKLVQLLSVEPAKLAGLSGRKGKVAVGYDADLVVFDPDGDTDTSEHANKHRHKITPYEDEELRGVVKATIVNGHFVMLFNKMARESCGLPVQDL